MQPFLAASETTQTIHVTIESDENKAEYDTQMWSNKYILGPVGEKSLRALLQETLAPFNPKSQQKIRTLNLPNLYSLATFTIVFNTFLASPLFKVKLYVPEH
jgi:hypothetical protein